MSLLITSALSKDKITSYKPGPNLLPTSVIRKGCPTPLKLVLCLSIKDFITGSRLSLFNRFDRYSNKNSKDATIKYVEIANKYNITPTQLALSFVNHQPFVQIVR